MSAEKINRSKLLQVRVTPKELEKIRTKFTQTTCRKMSDYVRRVLLEKSITTNQRNQSLDDFMTEMILLRNELNAIGNNFNQTVKRLHALQQIDEIKTWLTLNETTSTIVLRKIDEIKSKINQIDSQWLQS